MVWYHFPDPADASVARVRPIAGSNYRSTAGASGIVCLDEAGENLAPILNLDGDPIPSTIQVDDRSSIPRFRGPENWTLLWFIIPGFHPLPLRADFSEQMTERVRPGATPVESRPEANSVPVGTPWFDTVTHQTHWSDGEVWRRHDGTDAAVPVESTSWETPAGAQAKANTAASNAVISHRDAMDPHGDRAYIDERLDTIDGGGVEG